MGKSRRLSAVLSLALIVAASAVFGSCQLGYDQGEGAADHQRITGIIEYSVRDAQGNVKAISARHNTTLAGALELTMRRLIDNSLGVTADTDTFRRIAALNNNEADDAIAGGILVGSVTLLLDGDTGTTGNQNPANGTYADVGTTSDGQGRVQLTFTAGGAATIERLLLTKAAVDDTAANGAVAIAEADVLAWQDVAVTLASGDTLQVTWTINVD